LDPVRTATLVLVAVATSAAMTPFVSRLALALNVVDRPNERKVSRRDDMPLLGGLAVAAGCTLALLVERVLWWEQIVSTERLFGFLIGGALLLVMGACDDGFGLRATAKLFVQILAAAVAFQCGFRIEYLSEPFLHQTFSLPVWLSWPLTTLWVVAVTNAVNLIDGLDGLATGLSAIIAATLTVICIQADQMLGVLLGAALLGALVGFLPFNFPPARIFLGDTGAHYIGFALALIALEAYRKVALLTFVVPLLALAVPLLDTALSVLRRIRSRKRVFGADSLHMHHRLLRTQGSHRRAVLSLYFLTGCFCILAVSFTRLHGYTAIAFLTVVAVLTFRLLWNLGAFSMSTDGVGPIADRPNTIEGDEQ
jgi:UDP-GlcNAc:undecaprenyl-phosphate GlcNAc-1-phosphate transferase